MFDEIIEQERVTGILKNAILHDQIAHAYFFTGPAGIGKKTLARAFAEILRCTAPIEKRPCGICPACRMMAGDRSVDVLTVEPEAGSKTIKIRQIREVIGKISEKTYDGNVRISFIFGAEQMTVEAQNALLKSLEEPAEQNVFLLTSEAPEKVLPTIRSRCQILALDLLSDAGMAAVLQKHGYEGNLEDILSECGGNPGRAIDMMTNSEMTQLKTEAFSRLQAIIKGDPMPVFALSENMGKNKNDAAAVLDDWIRGFECLYRGEKTGLKPNISKWQNLMSLCRIGTAEQSLEILFELSRRLDSNVNARLQWEAALLKIYRLQSEN